MANSNTSSSDSPLETALKKIPSKFRQRTIKHFSELKQNLLEERFGAVGIDAGKLCEIVLRLLQEEITQTHIPFGKSIGNFADECRKLITASNTSTPESLRTVVPRALIFIYTIRNKRGIGHVGGDIDANRIDASVIAHACDWVICELIRVYHNLSLEEAQDLVDSLAQRNLPDIWHVAGKKRVLRNDLNTKQQVLLLCYQEPESSVPAEDLCLWVEYSSLSMFKTRVLVPLHKERKIEFDAETEMVILSPIGIREIENDVLRPTLK
jgi:hypothetical protein